MLRKGKTSDIKRLCEIEKLATDIYYQAGFTKEEASPRTEENLLELIKDAIVIVYEENNSILGYAAWRKYSEYSHLEEISVDPRHHKKGIGSSLVKHNPFLSESKIVSLICYSNAPWAYNLYKKLGFEETTKLPMELQDIWQEEVYRGLNMSNRICMINYII
ncbi:GNAT family N-acetyltransferase [Alkaliphilus pronyensis]|uniref:GNAT family N-acetyltransferase n=1 Tax=Alkaliphilus pronyensis TaxID=1482732 RepID=A0A6I0FFY5_9FIRM|nr:GNAT family N-acetyltransferase [Alkaliphilus pronyensis]KAB3534861.1 GNAT family N-acetyltransferase [Alkaliphilus pronyensis]